MFEKGRYVGVDGYYSRPSVQGRDAMGFSTGDVAPSYGQWGLSYNQFLTQDYYLRQVVKTKDGLITNALQPGKIFTAHQDSFAAECGMK